MSNLTVTKSYADGSALTKALLDAAFDSISTYINARDAGSAAWLTVNVTSTVANVMTLASSAASTNLNINNTATDGDPLISLQLSGVDKFSFYVDDSSSDNVIFTTGTAGTVMKLYQDGTRLSIPDGSATVPGIAFLGTTNEATGFSRVPSADQILVVVNGEQQIKFANGSIEVMADNDIDVGSSVGFFKQMYSYGYALKDGVTAPSTVAGNAQIYVDTSDGDLKIKFGDGTVKTIVTD